MAGGTIYGSDAAANSNTAGGGSTGGSEIPPGAALYVRTEGIEAAHGTLSSTGTFTKKGDLPVAFDAFWLGGVIETTIKVKSDGTLE